MRLLDQPDDLQIFGSRIHSFFASPILNHVFLSSRNSRACSATTSFRAPGFPAQVLNLSAGCRTRRVARKPPLASLQELLRPDIIEALGDAFTPTQLRDAVVSTQAVQHNTDLLSAEKCLRVARRMSFTIRSAEDFGLQDFWLISVPRDSDEPETLRSSNL